LVRNVPWIIMLLVTVLVFITLALKGGFYIYFFQDCLGAPAFARFLHDIGFNHFISGLNATLHAIGLTDFKWPDDAPTSAFGLFNGCGIIMMIIGIGFSKPLADRFGKRNTFATALFISTIFVFSFNYFFQGRNSAVLRIANAARVLLWHNDPPVVGDDRGRRRLLRVEE
jgi:GPH family glycoside/pentoside/hexuronide:cation symporter